MELTNINGTVFLKVSVSRLFRGRSSALGEGGGEVFRTAHDGPYASDEVDDLGLDARVGPCPEGRVIRRRGEVDCARAGGGKGVSHFGFLFHMHSP